MRMVGHLLCGMPARVSCFNGSQVITTACASLPSLRWRMFCSLAGKLTHVHLCVVSNRWLRYTVTITVPGFGWETQSFCQIGTSTFCDPEAKRCSCRPVDTSHKRTVASLPPDKRYLLFMENCTDVTCLPQMHAVNNFIYS